MTESTDINLEPPKASKPANNAALFVSLYIVLLAFFIMLNSISRIDDEKSQDALDSVSTAFSLKRPITSAPELLDSVGTEITHDSLFYQLQTITSDGIPILELTQTEHGNEMFLKFSKHDLFQIDMAITPAGEIFLSRLAEILSFWQGREPLTIRILSGLEEEQILVRNRRLDIISGQGAILLRQLQKLGVPSQNLAIGTSERVALNEVLFRFTFTNTTKSKLELKAQTP